MAAGRFRFQIVWMQLRRRLCPADAYIEPQEVSVDPGPSQEAPCVLPTCTECGHGATKATWYSLQQDRWIVRALGFGTLMFLG